MQPIPGNLNVLCTVATGEFKFDCAGRRMSEFRNGQCRGIGVCVMHQGVCALLSRVAIPVRKWPMRNQPLPLLSLLYHTTQSPNPICLRVTFRGYRSSAIRRQVFGISSAISLVCFPCFIS